MSISNFRRFQILQVMLVTAAVIDIIVIWRLAEFLTVRDIVRPTEKYILPYATHGATVFISKAEWLEMAAAYVVGAVLVLGQQWLNYARRRSRP